MKSPENGMGTPKTPEGQEQIKYRIAWKNKETGATGKGNYVDKKTAEDWLEQVGKNYPEVEHWLESENKEK